MGHVFTVTGRGKNKRNSSQKSQELIASPTQLATADLSVAGEKNSVMVVACWDCLVIQHSFTQSTVILLHPHQILFSNARKYLENFLCLCFLLEVLRDWHPLPSCHQGQKQHHRNLHCKKTCSQKHLY